MATQNHTFMQMAHDMGLSVKQMIEMMKQGGDKPEVAIPASSGMPPPPPPPPSTMRVAIGTPHPSRTPSLQPPIPAEERPVPRSRTTSATRPPLPPPASRQVSPEAVPVIRDPSLPRPVPIRDPSIPPPIRDPSLASTTNYGRSRSRTADLKPKPSRKASAEPPRLAVVEPQPPRAASVEPIAVHREPSTVIREPSGDAAPNIILPIREEGARRGRSVVRKADTQLARKAIALLSKKQEMIQAEGQLRVHLGRFAKRFQAAQREPRVAASVQPNKTRDYDEIERAVSADPLAGGVRKKIEFPESAFLHRQRIDSAGERRLRYQGRSIRA